ncbi:MAG: Crp/Fnr family transcriptional regulator [Methylococcales bacterium]|nr:Crp/Fnr family transcriptional regulator [Methylococcales bacterium]
MNAIYSLSKNYLLDALNADQYERLFPHLELVSLPLGEVLYESGCQLNYVYFPITCIVALLYLTENGTSTEIAVIGNEGFIGIALFMGGGTMTHRAMVVSEGYAYRIRTHLILQEFNRFEERPNGALHRLLLQYIQALMTQISQTAVCNRHHTVNQQLCRWLLLSLDRLPDNKITMTQELIANMLGVRRESVTDAAGKLQHAGMIDYHRGHITVLDRLGLEAQVCECYQVVKDEFSRLIPALYVRPPVTSHSRAMRE